MVSKSAFMVAAAAVALAVPGGVSAQEVTGTHVWQDVTCGGSTLKTCVEFTLNADNAQSLKYYFSVTYLSSLALDPGVVRAVSIYDLSGNPDYGFSAVALESAPNAAWAAFDNDPCATTGGGVGNPLFEACAERTGGGSESGLHVGEMVKFSFTSNLAISSTSFTEAQGLGARAHIQSFGALSCSGKLDNRSGGFATITDADWDACGDPATVTPEPGTVVLLFTGLLGVALMMRRRRSPWEAERPA